MLSVRFWGVRGSIPCPGRNTVIYGGNTACIEIRADQQLNIVDLGSGACPFGDWLIANDMKKNGNLKANIFITHTHWDHIMGFPMFTPVYMENTELRITGPMFSETGSIKTVFETQLSHNYWPIRLNELSAKIDYNQIKETTLDLSNGLTVTSKLLNHPVACLGYRFNYEGKSVALIYDHEPFAAAEDNEKIIRFLKDADILIHDSQYTNEEYPVHIGWGHSTLDNALQTAAAAGVKTLVFFHHDPSHTDAQLKKLEKIYSKKEVKCVMAKEGMTLKL